MRSGDQRRWICWKCQGTLKPQSIDLQTGFIVLQFVCQDCHRPCPAGVKPKPLMAA